MVIRERLSSAGAGEDAALMATPQASPYSPLAARAQFTTPDDDYDDVTASLLSLPLLSSNSSPFNSPRKRRMGVRQVGKQGAIVLLCCINLLNYIDRGIIPGAPEKFNQFITDTLGVSVLKQSVYFGLLTSAFIASYSIFSIVFGYLALSHRPFRIIAFGMSVWVVAVVICGIAQALDSYYVLIIGRLVSGVGEASFQCTATPFIDRYAPPASRSLYLGIYLASITVGTALGYIYGSIFANSGLGWAGAYYVEGVVMVGFVVCCLVIVPDELNQVPTSKANEDMQENKQSDNVAMLPATPENNDEKMSVTAFLEVKDKNLAMPKPSFIVEWWQIFRCVPFMLIILGHAAYTFSLAAMSTFSPAIFIGLGLFESETTVSLIFGGLVAITGTIGTPVGGILVDRLAKKAPNQIGRRMLLSVRALFYFMIASVIFGLIMVAFTSTKMLFPESRRSMAVAANTLVIHALGDVPSPIILGAIKDSWAPHCGTVEIDGEAKLNPRCSEDHEGLRNVLLFAVAWLAWGVLLWGASLVVVKRRQKEQQQRAARIGMLDGSL
ncbi:hypothetical protein BBJ29_002403 [Phytophthora kernoviae]|uniref:Major facilitator superfamily (MFS) profile domain-containing protein n=1 Tax=Phytophthora kernoviae TaxID=325452 RepID=A0A3F2RSL3_9STRA|nr:hypothetical protein BBJ29_002403 [Phytophthora kernoviae]RLN62915.1 hypothetical protein BBP00_00004445 [Phytophthora kernoviae]